MIPIFRCCLVVAALVFSACGKPESTAPAADSTDPQSIVERDVRDIRGEEIRYESDGVALTGYLAYDAMVQGRRPGVLIVHEWWGHNDYVRQRARMLAELGYTALAVDMYGDGKQAAHPDDAQKFMMEVLSNMESAAARFTAARSVLENHPSSDPEKVAAIGYCFGGALVLHMARSGADLDAVASFHGSLGTSSPAAPGAIKARLLVAHGADDPFVPDAEVDAFKAEMAAAGADLNFVAYPGAMHSFTNPGATAVGEQFDLPLRYDESADRASWAALQLLLSETFTD